MWVDFGFVTLGIYGINAKVAISSRLDCGTNYTVTAMDGNGHLVDLALGPKEGTLYMSMPVSALVGEYSSAQMRLVSFSTPECSFKE